MWALVSPDGVAPSQMVSVSASVNLPLHHKVKWLWWWVYDEKHWDWNIFEQRKRKTESSIYRSHSKHHNTDLRNTALSITNIVANWLNINYFAPRRGAKSFDQHVCTCLFAYLKKPDVQTSPNFLYMSHVAVAWLGPPLTTMQYVLYHFQFCGWRHKMTALCT